ncbi:hypothetical protein [Tropheryma whipplei]|nr:hypothetical protein [Tropheryma whipplei]
MFEHFLLQNYPARRKQSSLAIPRFYKTYFSRTRWERELSEAVCFGGKQLNSAINYGVYRTGVIDPVWTVFIFKWVYAFRVRIWRAFC